MMKFFRKYNRVLLAVLLSLLMVVFIGGVALETALAPDPNLPVAKTRLGPIGSRDQAMATAKTGILQSMGMTWNKPVPGGYPPIDVVDWIMLTREVRQFATPLNERAALAWLGPEATPSLNRLSRNLGFKSSFILEAIADFRSIQQMAQTLGLAAVPSAAQVRAAAKEVLDRVQVNAVVLPASAFVDSTLTFSDEEIAKQWAPYKDLPKGEGLNFGYYLPVRVEVQFLAIDINKIAAELGVANLEKKARRYFDENRSQFTRLSLNLPLDPAEPGATATWEEAKERAMEAVRRQVARENAARIADWLIQAAAEPFVDAERLKSGYRKAPLEIAVESYYERLAQNIPPSIRFPGAVETGIVIAFAEEHADTVVGLGQATHRLSSGEILTLRSLAFRSEPAVPVIPKSEGGRSDYLAYWQTCPYPLTNEDEGKMYVFRVTRSGDGRPSLDPAEVRSQILEDLRLLRAVEAARQKASGLVGCALASGLKDAYDADAELQSRQKEPGGGEIGFFSTPPVARLETFQVGTESPNRTVYAGPGVESVPVDLVDEWFALGDASEKYAVQVLKDRAAVLVVELGEIKEATREQFEGLRDLLTAQMTSRRTQEAINSWMNPENIRARNQFALIGAEKEE